MWHSRSKVKIVSPKGWHLLGLYWVNGKENGNYSGYRDSLGFL